MYARLCQLNQQMILAAGLLDVNPIAMLLLQPLFLLLSQVGDTTDVLPRTRTSEVSHSSPSMTPLPRLPHLRVVPVWVRSAWCGQRGQHGQRHSIGRVLYVERLTAGSTAAASKCLLVMRKKLFLPLTAGTVIFGG